MSDTVQQVKDRLSILDVVAPYVELHKAGKNFKGKSPFSAEKTPSFYVSPDRGMYYCFSTSQGGDIFTFIQAMEGVDFREALKQLAERAGVELTPENPEKRTQRERWYAALEAATVFYAEQLERELEAVGYLERRGVKPETIAQWRIGYAPGPPRGGWRDTKTALEAQGFTREELLATGLIKTTDSGKEPFDVFRDRIVFPMAEPSGKVVAYSGRILEKDSEAPKYVNSPETELYKKSELLFGYDKAKYGIRQLGFSLIVEGQFDVVMSHQAGYSNAVAVSGTALTLHHVQLLERLSDKVVLALDSDRAGVSAVKRSAELMLGRGLDVKVAELPTGEDPADLIQQDVAIFKQTIGKSVHVIEFLLHVLTATHSDARTLKLAVRNEVLPFVLLLPNRIDQDHFVHVIAEGIGAGTDAIRYELDRLRDERRTPAPTITKSGQSDAPVEPAGDRLFNLRLFLESAVTVLPPAGGARLRSELDVLDVTDITEPDEALQAKTTFELEEQFAQLPKLAVFDEVAARFNRLRTGLIQRRLSSLRQALGDAADEAAEARVLDEIGQLERQLREPPVSPDTFAKAE